MNAWRSLFLVNELNELQNYKIINTNLSLFLYALFMQGFGLRYWANHDPVLGTERNNAEESWVIFFFISTLVMYTIAIVQYVGRYAIKKWYPLKTEEFTDLCSITNISVMLFDDSFGGYYIHGCSPYGFTEISTEKLRRSLEQESRGQGQIRGLSPDNPTLQTYQVFIPIQLFEKYRTQYVNELKNSINECQSSNQALSGAASKFFSREKAIPSGLSIDKTETPRRVMNKLFMRCVEQVRGDPKRYIKKRTWFERLINRIPNEITGKNAEPVFYKDPWFSFGSFFLLGMDWDFVMLDSCIMAFIMQVTVYEKSDNLNIKLLLGVLVAYLLDQGLFFIRSFNGRRNLARHTLVDDKFLF